METVISGASGDNNNVGQNIHADWESILHALGINKLAHAITEEDIVGKQLPSIYHWKTFYQQYSRGKGFSIRVENVRKKSDGIEWQRRWVCSREGFRRDKWLSLENRKKKPKEITRIGCKAFLRVSLNKTTNNWYAAAFKTEHNHDLASPSELQFLRSHRQVPDSMLAQAQSMRRAGIRTMSIIEYMAQQCGGRDKLPFMPKDLYNKLGSSRLAVGEETDSEGALGYLTCLAVKDDYFFCRFNVDEEDRLHTIFWADGISRNDYNVFGDVLAFDTTYRTNAYNKPLLIFVGVNHHFRTCVYGVALLADETLSTFSWVLSQFLECMGSRPPKVVLTDGDPAMKKAISLLLPHAVHRLCAWHLSGNAISNVSNGEFKIQFSKLMYNYYTEQEFEER